MRQLSYRAAFVRLLPRPYPPFDLNPLSARNHIAALATGTLALARNFSAVRRTGLDPNRSFGARTCRTPRRKAGSSGLVDDPDAFAWMLTAGLAFHHLGRNEAAAVWLSRSIDARPNSPRAHSLLAAALGNLGRLDDGKREVEAALALDPAFLVGQFRHGARSDNPVYLEQRERIIAGLRKAGPPEG